MGTTDARRALLGRLIDHAPMFPPASLPVVEALTEDARAVASPHAFMLARLVWPTSALAHASSARRPLSAVLDAVLPAGTAVAAVEARYREDLESLTGLAPEIYVEVQVDDDLDGRLDRLAEHGFSAKVRCGGDVVPTGKELALFVRACRVRALPFKATAGLHHAVRTNGEHGFLNLLAAVTFDGDEEQALAETNPGAFTLGAESFGWRDRSARGEELARIRAGRIHSIGSCSFLEPVEELEALGVLPL